VGPEAYNFFLGGGDPLYEKNTKLGKGSNIYLRPLAGSWKGSVQVRGPEP